MHSCSHVRVVVVVCNTCMTGSMEVILQVAAMMHHDAPFDNEVAWCRGNAEPQLQAAQASVEQAHAAAHAVLKRIATAKSFSSPAQPDSPDPHATPATAGKEVTLAWMAAAMHACEPRLEGGEKAVLHNEYIKLGAPDGFALGMVAVALAFVTPVLNKAESSPADMLPKLAPAAALSGMKYRLGSLSDARRLAAPLDSATPAAAAADVDAADDAEDAAPPATSAGPPVFRFARDSLSGAAGAAPPPSFIVECTYLAVRALQVGLLPSVHRANELVHMLSQQLSSAMAKAGGGGGRAAPPTGTPAGQLYDQVILVEDCQRAALLREGPAVAATRLLGLALGVVHAALVEGAAAEEAAAVPEPMVRDVLIFAGYVITRGAPDLFAASKNLHPSMLVRTPTLRADVRCIRCCTWPLPMAASVSAGSHACEMRVWDVAPCAWRVQVRDRIPAALKGPGRSGTRTYMFEPLWSLVSDRDDTMMHHPGVLRPVALPLVTIPRWKCVSRLAHHGA